MSKEKDKGKIEKFLFKFCFWNFGITKSGYFLPIKPTLLRQLLKRKSPPRIFLAQHLGRESLVWSNFLHLLPEKKQCFLKQISPISSSTCKALGEVCKYSFTRFIKVFVCQNTYYRFCIMFEIMIKLTIQSIYPIQMCLLYIKCGQ